MAETGLIRTPDQQVRVFVSSALQELAAERRAVRDATTDLRLVPVMFELGRQREDPGRTVRLLAAADALLQAAGTGWLLAYAATAPSDDDALPGLRSRIGDATFQEAWAQGAAMGRQRAVEYALQD